MKALHWSIAGIVTAGVAVAAWQLTRPSQPTDSAMQGGAGATAEGAPMVKVVLPRELSAEAQMGKRAFEAKCATCHGVNAAGRNGVAPPLVHRIYRPAHHGDYAFLMAAQNGVQSHHWPFGDMPPVEGITRAEIRSIVAYVRELQRANGIE